MDHRLSTDRITFPQHLLADKRNSLTDVVIFASSYGSLLPLPVLTRPPPLSGETTAANDARTSITIVKPSPSCSPARSPTTLQLRITSFRFVDLLNGFRQVPPAAAALTSRLRLVVIPPLPSNMGFRQKNPLNKERQCVSCESPCSTVTSPLKLALSLRLWASVFQMCIMGAMLPEWIRQQKYKTACLDHHRGLLHFWVGKASLVCCGTTLAVN
jgi:hypothetical protein